MRGDHLRRQVRIGQVPAAEGEHLLELDMGLSLLCLGIPRGGQCEKVAEVLREQAGLAGAQPHLAARELQTFDPNGIIAPGRYGIG